MLTIDDFDKAEQTSTRRSRRGVKMTPKEPIAGLAGLEISVFLTGWKRGDSEIWGWEWKADRYLGHSSLDKDTGAPAEHHHNLPTAALAAIKDVSYYTDEERLPREERARQERDRKNARLDTEIDRFLRS